MGGHAAVHIRNLTPRFLDDIFERERAERAHS